MEYWGYEIGPIRPPSEAYSLLIRITRNCHWNRCTFCPVYKEREFSRRTVAEVKNDIDTIWKYVEQLDLAKSEEDIRSVGAKLFAVDPNAYRSAILWYRNGMKSVFLQDADSLIIPPQDIIEILEHLRNRFPSIERVTSYARSSTIVRIHEEDLKRIADSGLNRVHIGLESGSDEVLKRVRKGASKSTHISAGLQVRDTGMELSEYMMPGLGGKRFSNAHALESADALNQINPDFIRLRQVAVPEGKTLYEDYVRCSDADVVRELRLFVESLEVKASQIVSDHILNLLPEIDGQLPDDKKPILNSIDHFLNLDLLTQTHYQFGRRIGVLQGLKDLQDPDKMTRVLKICNNQGISPENIEEVTSQLMRQFI